LYVLQNCQHTSIVKPTTPTTCCNGTLQNVIGLDEDARPQLDWTRRIIVNVDSRRSAPDIIVPLEDRDIDSEASSRSELAEMVGGGGTASTGAYDTLSVYTYQVLGHIIVAPIMATLNGATAFSLLANTTWSTSRAAA